MPIPCDRILNAAETCFAGYGYNKTTMAEIAAGCGMSVGNLYRHFKNKEAIALASIERVLQAKLDAGIAAADQEDDALAALRAFLLTRLRIGHAHYAKTRHLSDMIGLVDTHHRDLLLDYESRIIEALAHILERGIAQGSFRRLDTAQTAYDIHQATLRYNNPVNLRFNALPELEADLGRLTDLLYRGLAC